MTGSGRSVTEERLARPDDAPAAPAAPGLLVHQAAFSWAPGAPEDLAERVLAALADLRPRLADLVSLTAGPSLQLSYGAADFGVCARFRSVAGYREYAEHPDHLRILHDLVLPHACARVVVQYWGEVDR